MTFKRNVVSNRRRLHFSLLFKVQVEIQPWPPLESRYFTPGLSWRMRIVFPSQPLCALFMNEGRKLRPEKRRVMKGLEKRRLGERIIYDLTSTRWKKKTSGGKWKKNILRRGGKFYTTTFIYVPRSIFFLPAVVPLDPIQTRDRGLKKNHPNARISMTKYYVHVSFPRWRSFTSKLEKQRSVQ